MSIIYMQGAEYYNELFMNGASIFFVDLVTTNNNWEWNSIS